MIKVGVITSYFPTSTNPWEGRSAYETVRVLSSLSDVHVFCPVATYPRLLKPTGRPTAKPDFSWRPEGVVTTYVPYPVLPLLSRPFNGVNMARNLLPHVSRFHPDILLNYMVYPDGYAAVRIAKSLKVPVVLTAIGSDLNRISDPICAKLTSSALRQADFVITVSKNLAKTAETLGVVPRKLRAIRNGCDTAVFRPRSRVRAREDLSLDQSAHIIVYVGRLDVRKGLVELIQATEALQQDISSVHTYIIGKGPDERLLRQAIERLNASAYITLIPPCASTEVATWMAASNLIALPSYNEGSPNVIIEGLAVGRPIVATNVGGIPELTDSNSGRLVTPKDVPGLINALSQVLHHEWNAEVIASRHNRSWESVSDDIFGLLVQRVHSKVSDFGQ